MKLKYKKTLFFKNKENNLYQSYFKNRVIAIKKIGAARPIASLKSYRNRAQG